MLLENKITITAINDGKENNSVETSTKVMDNVMEIMTTLEIAQRNLKEQVYKYLEKHPEKVDYVKDLTMGEIYEI